MHGLIFFCDILCIEDGITSSAYPQGSCMPIRPTAVACLIEPNYLTLSIYTRNNIAISFNHNKCHAH